VVIETGFETVLALGFGKGSKYPVTFVLYSSSFSEILEAFS